MRKIITGIINLDINNIKSVCKATEIYSNCYVINDYRDFKKNTDCLILPGNGFFYEGAKNLKNKNLFDIIQKFALDKKKIIGICLGMHLLMENSEESPNIEGLGVIEGSVNKITNSKYKLPLLGWYDTKFKDNFFDQINLYYNNQFACNPRIKDLIIGNIGGDIPSIIKKDYIFGLQFHPEKSSNNGLKILEKILTKY
jgi:glutamine amidotransferase